MCAALTLTNTRQCSLFHSLCDDIDQWTVYTIAGVETVTNTKSTFLCWGKKGIEFPAISKEKWEILEEIELAQTYFWQFDDYHREMCRINVLYYTITLRNINTILLNLLNEKSAVECDKTWSIVEGTTTRIKKFSIVFPANYLIKKKTFVIINSIYYFRNALYQATCIEYIGSNDNTACRYV